MTDLYRKCVGPIMAAINTCTDASSLVMDYKVKDFFKIQRSIRRKVGSGQNSRSGFQTHLVKRTEGAGKAKAALEHARADAEGEKGMKLCRRLKDLAQQIQSVLKSFQADISSRLSQRLDFYPDALYKSPHVEKSPEDALEVFLALETCQTVLGSAGNQKALIANDCQDLKTLVRELACILDENLTGPGAVGESVNDAISALQEVENAAGAWREEDMREMFSNDKSMLTKAIQDFHSAKMQIDIAALKAASVKSKNTGKTDKYAVPCAALYKAQKEFITSSTKCWILQRNYLPEIYHDLFPVFTDVLPFLLQTVDTQCDVKAVTSLVVNGRSLHDYEIVGRKSEYVSIAKSRGKMCMLKSYRLTDRNDLRAMVKYLAFQNRLDENIAVHCSAAFVDNSMGYVHVPIDGMQVDLYTVLNDANFNDSVRNPVFLIRDILHVANECHKAGLVVGNLSPTSFFLDNNNIPRIHTFEYARLNTTTTGVRESRGGHDWCFEHVNSSGPPEIASGWSMASDMFSLGKTIEAICKAGKPSLVAAEADAEVAKLIAQCTKKNPTDRWRSDHALNWSDLLIKKLRVEVTTLLMQKKGIIEMKNVLKKARRDLEHAAGVADEDLVGFRYRKAAIQDATEKMKKGAHVLAQFAHQVEGDGRRHESLKVPVYWNNKTDDVWEIFPVDTTSMLFQVFRYIIQPSNVKALNVGRDVKERGRYTQLALHAIWRIENPILWRQYAVERRNMKEMFHRRRMRVPVFLLRKKFQQAIAELPGTEALFKDCNETYLLHGTGPGVILSICTSGVNERFTTAALFGKGSYFGEDSAKVDQYVEGDSVYKPDTKIHKRLFPAGQQIKFPTYPYKAYYLFLCRYLGGFAVRVQSNRDPSGINRMVNLSHRGANIWATADRRELGNIPGCGEPAFPYHSLIAELGGTITRFREFCQFHSSRVYPEYLICYTRR